MHDHTTTVTHIGYQGLHDKRYRCDHCIGTFTGRPVECPHCKWEILYDESE